MKTSDSGVGKKKFGHAIVAGIDRYPRKITKSMTSKKTIRRARIKPFIKAINYNHVMPTRYEVDWDVKKFIPETTTDGAVVPESRKKSKKELKDFLQKAYLNTENGKDEPAKIASAYFFTKLHF